MNDKHAEHLDRMNRFVAKMNAASRDLSSPYVRPKDAATLILVDRSGKVPKVLLGKRHDRHKFMPGRYVFPGGRVDPEDRRMPVAQSLHPHAEAQLMKRMQRPSAAKARAFALAAIRETFEETGITIADPNELVWTSRWITPVGVPKRFDTYFYLAKAPLDAVVTIQESEAVDHVWIAPADALKTLKMVFPTIKNLEALLGFESAAALIESRRGAVIEPVQPILVNGKPALP